MTFPTVPTTGNTRILSQNQNDTTATRTFPTLSSLTKNSGDLLVAIVVAYERTAAGATFSGWTGGFAELADVDGGATTMAVGIATKASTGSETGTFATTQATTVVGHCSLFVMSIEGWHGTTAPELTALAVDTLAAADAAALSPSWGAADTLWIAVGGNGETNTGGSWTGMGANTPPTNYADGNSPGIGTDAVGGIESTVAFRQNNTASENVGTWSTNDISNARNCALLIAIRPLPDTIVTPAVVAAVAAVPAVTVQAGAVVVATMVAAVVSVPEPKAVGGIIGPVRWDSTNAQWGSTTAQWGGASGDVTIMPATVAAIASVPAITIVTIAAVTVAAIATVPAVTVQAGTTVTPAAVAAVASVPTVTITIRNVSEWSEVVTATSFGGGVTISVDRVAAVASIPDPTVTGEALVTSAVVAAIAAVPAVTVAAGAIVVPATVAATATVPAPTVSGAALVAPATVVAVAAVPAVTVTGSALVVAATVAAIADIPAPAVTAGGSATVSAAVVVAVAAIPAPTVLTGVLFSVATVAAIAAVPAPTVTVQVSATVTPATVVAVVTIPAPGLRPVNAQSTAIVTARRTSVDPVTAGRTSVDVVAVGAMSSTSSVTD